MFRQGTQRVFPGSYYSVRSGNLGLALAYFLNPWSLGVLLQALMIVHFFRNRPEGYWFWVIVFLGPIGAAVYFFVEVLPGFNWKMPVFERWERARRREWLEKLVSESPSQEALCELALIRGKDGDHVRAIELYGQALRRDPEDSESLYGRGLSAMETGDYASAVKDLTALAKAEPSYRLQEGNLALAEAYEGLGEPDKASQVYRSILKRTQVSQAYFCLGRLLANQGEIGQAREMMQEIIMKQAVLPRYLRRLERPWVWRARKFLKMLSEPPKNAAQ